jgi:hypothetical protein
MIRLPGALALVWQLKDNCTRLGRVQQRSVIQRIVQVYEVRLKSLMVQTPKPTIAFVLAANSHAPRIIETP